MQRYFVDKIDKDVFVLNDIDSNHFLKVMRGNIGTKLEIVYKRKVYLCKTININPLKVQIINEIEDSDNLFNVDIAQALVKEQKMDYILQKSTELGVRNIIPLKTTRSIVKLDNKKDKKIERWNTVVQEASKQAKRLEQAKVLSIMSIDDIIKLDYDYKILCSVNEMSTNIKRVLDKVSIGDRILFVVGPEGGFTPEEETKLISNGFVTVSLGNNVLRTETVSLFLLSIIGYHFMR